MYFDHLPTVGQIKTEYRRLAKLHHPDLGGDTATMQRINAAYHAALERCDGQTSLGSDGKEHTYYYKQDIEQEIMDKISELLSLRLPGVNIELVGTWIWIDGNTKPVKDALKAAGCQWHSKRVKWYWRRFTHRRRYSDISFDQLRRMYGAQAFDAESDRAMVPA